MAKQALLELRLAVRYLAGQRGQGTFSLLTILAVLGNLVGVMALVVGQAVMTGQQARITEALVAREAHIWLMPAARQAAPPAEADTPLCLSLSLADLATLGLTSACAASPPPARAVSFDEALVRDLQAIEAITSLRPTLDTDVFLNLGGRFDVRVLRGASLADLRAANVQIPALPNPQDFGLILPAYLLAQPGFEVGAPVRLITTKLQPTIVGALPLIQEFTIIGTYPAYGGNEPLLTTLATAQLMLDLPGGAGAVALTAADPFDLRDLTLQLAGLNDGSFTIETWDQRNDSRAAFIGVMRMVLLLVLGLIILVSAFNIFAGQLMLTDAQRSAIAVMRTFGASQGTILRIFLLAGLLIGLIGAGLGLLLGILIALNFPLLIQLGVPGFSFFAGSPPIVRGADLALAVFIALALALIAAFFPARAAARIPPVEALHYG